MTNNSGRTFLMGQFFLFPFLLSLAGSVLAYTGTVTVSADIGSALSISQGTAVDFGVIVPDTSTTTTITMAASGALGQTGTAVIESAGTVGTFSITGTTGKVVAISYASSATLSSGANTMTFTPADGLVGATGQASCTIDTNCGTSDLKIYGNLAVGAGQATGAYSGTFTITAVYNDA